MQWINAQTNLMDSLRYLIEREIAHHGVRNLQTYVPAERSMLRGGEVSPDAMTRSPYDAVGMESAAATEAKEGVLGSNPEPFQEAAHRPEPPAEEEIDDDDIEAWI